MEPLTPPAARILGALIEKQLTTPQQYPLTLNALLSACNQTSSRNPVVSYEEHLVDTTLHGLKSRGLVRFVYPSHGRSATRFRQVLEEEIRLDGEELALIAILLLRGPQTVGELRSRTERMVEFRDLRHVEDVLDALAGRDEPLVARMAREAGRKEERWTQLLAPDTGAVLAALPDRDDAGGGERGQSLAAQVAALQEEMAALRRDVDALRALLD